MLRKMSPSRLDREVPKSSLKHWITPPTKGVRSPSNTTAASGTKDSPKKLKGKKGNRIPEPSPNRQDREKPRLLIEEHEMCTNNQEGQGNLGKGNMDKDNGTEEMDIEGTEEKDEEARDKRLPLEGLKFLATGVFPEIAEGKEPQWGPASDLYNGRNTLKRLVTSYGGQFNQSITKQTKFLIVGLTPSEKAIDKAHTGNVDLISYAALEGMIAGTVMPEFASFEPQPEIEEYLHGSSPPNIQRDKNLPRADPMETEETAAAKVTFTGVTVRKCNEVSTPEGTPERPNLVAGSSLLGKKGIIDITNLRKNKCKYVSVVHATLRVPHGDVKNLVMDLMFMGLDTLRAEDKSVCFLHSNDPNQRAKARKDMPVKFQKIHKEWMVFDQPIGRFKNDIKEGRTRTYNVSV